MRVSRRISFGFTLLELVAGIALFAVVLLLITGAFLPMINKQTQPIYQVRAAELAQRCCKKHWRVRMTKTQIAPVKLMPGNISIVAALIRLTT